MILKFLRNRKNMKRIMWALAILIIPAFVIWGVGSSGKRNDKGPGYAGKIFNKKISFDEYVDMSQVTRDYLTKNFGGNVPEGLIDEMTWNRLLLLESSKKENIIVKDSEIVEKIVSFPIFQRNGVFDKKVYKSMLEASARGFEERLRDDIAISKLREKRTSNISISDEEVKKQYKDKNEKVKGTYVTIPFSDFEKDVVYEDKDILNFYQKNKEQFRKPDEVNVQYIEIPLSRFDNDISISDEGIQKYFEEHLTEFKKESSEEPPILNDEIKKNISEKLSTQKKQSLAEELGYKVMDNVLKKRSLDSAKHLFNLEIKETGFFNITQQIPGIGWSYEFTRTSFTLKIGEISNIILKTDKGYYIIQLKEKHESYLPDLEEVKDAVKSAYIKNKAVEFSRKNVKRYFRSFREGMKNGRTFEDISQELKLEPKKTDFISQDSYIETLGPANAFVQKASSLKTGEIAVPVKMLQSWVILRLDEYQTIDETKFLEEKETLKQELLTQKKDSAFNKWFLALKKSANLISYTSN